MEPTVGIQGMNVGEGFDPDRTGEIFELAADLGLTARRVSRIAQTLPPRARMQAYLAIQALAMASSALYSSLDVQCDLDEPHTGVDVRPRGTEHRLIARCEHDPPHCWEGTVMIDCPDP